MLVVQKGDRLVWYRVGNEDFVTVVDVKEVNGRQKVHLKVDGWASDGGWEFLDYNFVTVEEHKRRKEAEKAAKKA